MSGYEAVNRRDVLQFDFGRNWADFTERALTPERVEQARRDFERLMDGIPLAGRTFLDIGFGQGLSLLTAAAMGALASGLDVNPLCADVLARNRSRFPELGEKPAPARVGSILDESVVESLRRDAPDGRLGYDIVHSWGVLHHTGDMWLALDNAASLVRPGGHLILALYNRHFTSPAWSLIKRFYVNAPSILQRAAIAMFYPVIWLAKLVVTGSRPGKMTRGMDFYYNVVDWVGGWPYEYASVEEVVARLEKMGFRSLRVIPTHTPTGCNEFVCVREN